MLEALLFDVDGTIAETEDLHRRAFNLAFRDHGMGLDWSPAEYRRLLAIHGGKERIARALAEHGVAHDARLVAAIHATKTKIYQALLAAEGAPWRPGLRRLIGEARRAGLRLALATSTTEANLHPLFAPVFGYGWRDRFDAVVTGDAIARKKPAPDTYVEALRRLGVDAAHAVAFEDSGAGVEAAKRAGLAVIATRSHWFPNDDLDAADLLLEHLGDAGLFWEQPHPLIRQRWLSVKALATWHERLQRRDRHGPRMLPALRWSNSR
ncbi:MAG TPA: HAD-IA family hydrolase [Usitatibacter sp.]|nr:HAD-IA family hydrolase [Usitatibacter sp.]